ncbi:MAG: hypothetical protein LIR46_07860 [Bacteroidota bacterium]|nr:hypothetical protein [Bacteroidota bacterium]
MLIKFTKDFANNWKVGDVVNAKYLEKGEVLVDDVAKIEINMLLKHCRVISESETEFQGIARNGNVVTCTKEEHKKMHKGRWH